MNNIERKHLELLIDELTPEERVELYLQVKGTFDSASSKELYSQAVECIRIANDMDDRLRKLRG